MKGKDKLYHLIAGFAIALLIALLINPTLGIVTAILAGVGKEVYDKYYKKSTPDPLDALATIVGGIIGLVICLLITNFLL
jgi:uncharacterized membrane protein